MSSVGQFLRELCLVACWAALAPGRRSDGSEFQFYSQNIGRHLGDGAQVEVVP